MMKLLSSIFQQCDISLNQRTINTSVGSCFRYKAYFDVLLNSSGTEAESILQTELFYKDTAGAMYGTGIEENNIGHYDRMLHTAESKLLC